MISTRTWEVVSTGNNGSSVGLVGSVPTARRLLAATS